MHKGSPYAGNPLVRFGGKGALTGFLTPIIKSASQEILPNRRFDKKGVKNDIEP